MPLTYTVTRKITQTVTEERTLEPYGEWGMFTPKGNKRLDTLASRAIDKVVALKESKQLTRLKVFDILLSFVMAWEDMPRFKSYGEASDTAVRECVGSFCDELAIATGCWDRWSVHQLWDDLRKESWRGRQAKVAKKNKRSLIKWI